MLKLSHPTRAAGGIFHRLDTEWASLCADANVRAAVTDWLVTDHLADDVAAVTDSWVRALGPAELLTALRPGAGHLTDALTDAVLRALLRRAAGCDRSATLAARIIVQAMIPAAVRMTRGQVRPFEAAPSTTSRTSPSPLSSRSRAPAASTPGPAGPSWSTRHAGPARTPARAWRSSASSARGSRWG